MGSSIFGVYPSFSGIRIFFKFRISPHQHFLQIETMISHSLEDKSKSFLKKFKKELNKSNKYDFKLISSL